MWRPGGRFFSAALRIFLMKTQFELLIELLAKVLESKRTSHPGGGRPLIFREVPSESNFEGQFSRIWAHHSSGARNSRSLKTQQPVTLSN
jgi:hypothetical protein